MEIGIGIVSILVATLAGMMLGALNWSNFIEGLGIITAVCVTLAIAGWLALLQQRVRRASTGFKVAGTLRVQ